MREIAYNGYRKKKEEVKAMILKSDQELIDRIYAYRVDNDMSVKEFAERCHVTAQTIYMLLRGAQRPSKITRLKIEKVLNEKE